MGEAAYRVLPRDVLNSSLTPENLVAKVLANIEKRRAGYLELIAAIEADGYAKGIKGRLLDVVDGVDALLPALARAREPVLPAATRKL